jgi:FKBP-type peptidyl-prolyl cis-trans isomerase SlyD
MASDVTPSVADDMAVGIAYELRLDDEQLLDQAPDGDPLFYLHGRGNIIEGLEDALTGMKVGAETDVVLAPTDGYGEVDEDAFRLVPRDAFPADMQVAEGLEVELNDPDEPGQVYAIVSELREDGVLMDLNHPLAGETLHFHVKVVAVRPATATELEHGHIHGPGHAH